MRPSPHDAAAQRDARSAGADGPCAHRPGPRAGSPGRAALAPTLAGVLLVLAQVGDVQAQTPAAGTWLRPPAARAHEAITHAPAIALERRVVAGGIELVARNHLAGPVEVQLDAARAAPLTDPPLPVRATLDAGGHRVLARVGDGPDAPGFQLQAVPGAAGARHRDVEYLFPLRGAALRVTQGFGGGFSHTDEENHYAVDFAVDEGTPVLAARDGTVMQLESRIGGPAAAGDPVAHTNFVRVLHDDGTMALYAHLQRGGVVVASGERVRRGQVIAFSGNTGASGGPHLHFVVQANQGMRLTSLPFRMFGPGGILRFTAPARVPPH